MPIGYEFLRQEMALQVPPPSRSAELRPVTRIERQADVLAVPRQVAPGPLSRYHGGREACLVDHLLFALRYEGTHLGILCDALKQIPAAAMTAALERTPTGALVRKACYLWEEFTGQRLPVEDRPAMAYADVFDPALYHRFPSHHQYPLADPIQWPGHAALLRHRRAHA